MKNLSKQDLEFIADKESVVEATVQALDKVRQFKEGDFLLGFEDIGWGERSWKPMTNSYGVAKKFQVVHLDKNGIPYIKELNKAGNPVGHIICPIESISDDYDNIGIRLDPSTNFIIDTDYVDSVIMMDEENYDPMRNMREKSSLYKEIQSHNKSLRVCVDSHDDVRKFFDNVKVGDVFYKTINSFFKIISITKPPLATKANRYNEIYESFCTIENHKGVQSDKSIHDFMHTAIYTSRPRTYKETKDPK